MGGKIDPSGAWHAVSSWIFMCAGQEINDGQAAEIHTLWGPRSRCFSQSDQIHDLIRSPVCRGWGRAGRGGAGRCQECVGNRDDSAPPRRQRRHDSEPGSGPQFHHLPCSHCAAPCRHVPYRAGGKPLGVSPFMMWPLVDSQTSARACLWHCHCRSHVMLMLCLVIAANQVAELHQGNSAEMHFPALTRGVPDAAEGRCLCCMHLTGYMWWSGAYASFFICRPPFLGCFQNSVFFPLNFFETKW